MNKIIKIIIPSILMIALIYLWRNGKDILTGIYIVFPLIYMILGLINTNSKKDLIISLIILTLSFLILINYMFNMGTCIDLAIIYNVISFISYYIKRKVRS